MKYYLSWGKQDVSRPGREAKKTTYDIIEFETDSLTNAKARATREMKKDSRMERYVKTFLDGPGSPELAPPRWQGWSEPFRVGKNMMRTTKQSEGMDYPIMYANPQNDPGDQHPGHFGWVSMTWATES